MCDRFVAYSISPECQVIHLERIGPCAGEKSRRWVAKTLIARWDMARKKVQIIEDVDGAKKDLTVSVNP
jgi:hypothetical protein